MVFLKNSFYIAARYLRFHRGRTIVLVLALALILFVPVLVEQLVSKSESRLSARADSTPLLLGSPGSSLDLAMSSLYFVSKQPASITYGDTEAIDDTGLAYTIPLHTTWHSGGFRIVGTSLDYFDFRNLHIAKGNPLFFLGDAVLGASVAKSLNLKPGDSLISSPDNFIDIAGQYPLKMNVAGVLAPTGTADDAAVFVDLQTAWIIAGLGHGHQDLSQSDDASVILDHSEANITANAQLETFIEITPENIDSFHFHGNQKDFPVTAAIAVPKDEKSLAILLGRYQAEDQPLQLIRPKLIVDELVDTIFRIKKILHAVVVIVALATLLTLALVFTLSLRLRAAELRTIYRLGCSRPAMSGFVAAEIILILAASIALALLLITLTTPLQPKLITLLLST
ncbi:MAG: ABC transporter permease [Verrucomicrobiota bacterium]